VTFPICDDWAQGKIRHVGYNLEGGWSFHSARLLRRASRGTARPLRLTEISVGRRLSSNRFTDPDIGCGLLSRMRLAAKRGVSVGRIAPAGTKLSGRALPCRESGHTPRTGGVAPIGVVRSSRNQPQTGPTDRLADANG
jgi:hypothetical protein